MTLQKALAQLQRKPRRWYGILGNAAGQVAVSGRPGWYYARVDKAGAGEYTEGLFRAQCDLNPLLNYPIAIEPDPVTGEQFIVGPDRLMVQASAQTTLPALTLPAHAEQHAFDSGAADMLTDLHWLQLYPLRVQPVPGSRSVLVQGGAYYATGAIGFKRAAETVDLSALWPAGGVAYTLIYLDAAGAAHALAPTVARLELLTLPTGGVYALAAIEMRAVAAEVSLFSQIIDLRTLPQFAGGAHPDLSGRDVAAQHPAAAITVETSAFHHSSAADGQTVLADLDAALYDVELLAWLRW